METFSALLALCAGNSPVTGEFLSQRPVTQSFDVSFDMQLNKRWINNREVGDLRRHCAHYDVIVMPKIKQSDTVVYVMGFLNILFDSKLNNYHIELNINVDKRRFLNNSIPFAEEYFVLFEIWV